MIAKCPNSPDHKEFTTTAHIMQEWKVDEKGEFIRETCACLEVTHPPDSGNLWICCSCGATAIVQDN